MAEARNLPREELAGPAYIELLKERLEAETGRSDSLERRASATITASSFLSSLLVGLGTVAGLGDDSRPAWLGALFGLSLVLLLGAAGFALVANRIQKQREIPPREFDRLVNQFWNGSLEVGERRAAEVRISLYQTLYEKNSSVAKVLEWSHALQVAALFAVGVSAVFTVVVAR
ncbi:MAG TPA: hypothetical protein VG318_07780 [Actinomycetota bacterium]|nr:hypothetical protein [Actinomycetota bacterium]